MLAVMHEGTPYGYLCDEEGPIPPADLARMIGADPEEVEVRLEELERRKVLRRDKAGKIYSKRLVNDEKKSRKGRETGKGGGNPKLLKDRGKSTPLNGADTPGDNPSVKASHARDPEARGQRPDIESSSSTESHCREGPGNGTTPAAADSDLIKHAQAIADQVDEIACIRARSRSDLPPDHRPVLAWLKAGAEPEEDIYPVVREIMARDNAPTPGSIKYFGGPVLRSVEARKAGQGGNGASQPPKPYDPEDRVNALPERALRDYLAVWRRTGTWPLHLGPRPDSVQAYEPVKAMVETLKREAAESRKAEAAEVEP